MQNKYIKCSIFLSTCLHLQQVTQYLKNYTPLRSKQNHIVNYVIDTSMIL